MRKTFAGLLLGAAAAMIMSLGVAHADGTAVTIADADGATLISLPAASETTPYPSEFDTTLSGTAAFAASEGGVTVQYLSGEGVNTVVAQTREAALTCDESLACTWSSQVPFIMQPGEYRVLVTAKEVDPENEDAYLTAEASIGVLVL